MPISPTAVLVIGAHREELAFGEHVAAGLTGELIDIYRIPMGISGRHPRQDQAFRYRVCHQELYLQLRQQLKGRYRVLIDLHAGQDANAPAADVLCHDASVLTCLQRQIMEHGDTPIIGQRVRLIPLVDADETGLAATASDSGRPVGRALIPRRVWSMEEPLYVAVEVFLKESGVGCPADWALAQTLVRRILRCRSMNPNGQVAQSPPRHR
jgi:hypothetical protein